MKIKNLQCELYFASSFGPLDQQYCLMSDVATKIASNDQPRRFGLDQLPCPTINHGGCDLDQDESFDKHQNPLRACSRIVMAPLAKTVLRKGARKLRFDCHLKMFPTINLSRHDLDRQHHPTINQSWYDLDRK